jgi:hypothetical protein
MDSKEKELLKIQVNALRESVKKWSLISVNLGVDKGTENCTLCQKFYVPFCKNCPVYLETGFYSCFASPWIKWADHHVRYHDWSINKGYSIKCPECRELAYKELMFLQNLLEEYKERLENA